jgi:hypothetical protein
MGAGFGQASEVLLEPEREGGRSKPSRRRQNQPTRILSVPDPLTLNASLPAADIIHEERFC